MNAIDPDYGAIPESMQSSIILWVCRGIPMGSFGTSLMSNDLMSSYTTADSTNVNLMREYVSLMYNVLPRDCYGSMTAISKWSKARMERPLLVDGVSWPKSWSYTVGEMKKCLESSPNEQING